MSQILSIDTGIYLNTLTDDRIRGLDNISAYTFGAIDGVTHVSYGYYTLPASKRSLFEIRHQLANAIEHKAFRLAVHDNIANITDDQKTNFGNSLVFHSDVLRSDQNAESLCSSFISSVDLDDNKIVCKRLTQNVVVGISRHDLELPDEQRRTLSRYGSFSLLYDSPYTIDLIKREAWACIDEICNKFHQYCRESYTIATKSTTKNGCVDKMHDHYVETFEMGETLRDQLQHCKCMLTFSSYQSAVEMLDVMKFMKPDNIDDTDGIQWLTEPYCNVTFSRLLEWIDHKNVLREYPEE